MLAAGIGKVPSGYTQAVEAMRDAAANESMRLEHLLSYVGLIGALAPMIGLLGTVCGMVNSFMEIAASTTSPKPAKLAEGISTALITTLIGLVIAIVAVAGAVAHPYDAVALGWGGRICAALYHLPWIQIFRHPRPEEYRTQTGWGRGKSDHT